MMIEIFVPVLFICMNGYCEFLQAQTSYKAEAECWDSINRKKVRMLDIAEKTDQGKISTLEGSCISTWADDPKNRV